MKNFWADQRVLILGAARQGTALARYLVSQGAQIVLSDQRKAEDLQAARRSMADIPIQWALGGHPLELLLDVDVLFLSGGVPLTLPIVKEAQSRGIPLSNDSQLFLESAPCRVIGITGSAGKTTTTVLVGRMAETAAQGTSIYSKAWVGGNIGNPLIASLEEMTAEDIVVMELSSFQLEIMKNSPQVAAVLNITPNHLDRHLTMEDYTAAKARVLNFQSMEDIAVIGRDDPGASALEEFVRGHLASFGLGYPDGFGVGTFVNGDQIALKDGPYLIDLFPMEHIKLRGEHNLFNVLAACAIAYAAGLPVDAIRAGVADFHGVPHRLEFVRSWGGADWYNDSIATAPERAIAALRSFEEPLVLLAGGQDKNLSWDDFAAEVRQRVDHLVIFGEASEIVARAVGPVLPDRRPYTIDQCSGLSDAVEVTSGLVESGDVVLLAPGGTSFDEFHDFVERGERFQKWVNNLP